MTDTYVTLLFFTIFRPVPTVLTKQSSIKKRKKINKILFIFNSKRCRYEKISIRYSFGVYWYMLRNLVIGVGETGRTDPFEI